MSITIDKAIKRQELILRQGGHRLDTEDTEAIRLGKEGLKRIKHYRTYPYHPIITILPGETMD